MPQYLSPGVYVEEVPSAIQAIAGVGTSTAGFIGLIPDDVVVIPPGPVHEIVDEVVDKEKLTLKFYPVKTDGFTVKLIKSGNGEPKVETYDKPADVSLRNNPDKQEATVKFEKAGLTENVTEVKVTYKAWANSVIGESIAVGRKTQDAEGQPLHDSAGNPLTKTEVTTAKLAGYPVHTGAGTFTVKRITPGAAGQPDKIDSLAATLENDFGKREARMTLTQKQPLEEGERIAIDYTTLPANQVLYKEKIGVGDDSTLTFKLANFDVMTGANGAPGGLFQVRLGNYEKAAPETNVTITFDDPEKHNAKVVFTTAPKRNQEIWVDTIVYPTFRLTVVDKKENDAKLCTNFGDFKKHFGDFSTNSGQSTLAHAVYGFFHNGGTRCYVARMKAVGDVTKVLEKFAAIDEIAIIAAPGLLEDPVPTEIVAHCAVATQDRFAIFDSKQEIDGDLTKDNIAPPANSDYAAFYFPWIQVFDPATKTMDPKGDGRIYVPPSGHMAGIYARVDTNRGVHKAPANEPIMGALGLRYQISKAQQDGLNPQGINCIRELNGNIRVWGARTVGGDGNGEWRYINVRRTFLYLRESIDEGTQWAVFEPNDQNLWAKINRNITAFLTNVWRTGALFGSTPAEAFYVKCDAETNPPELRELGQVVTEIGVAVVRPAEFVIFRISQWQPQKA